MHGGGIAVAVLHQNSWQWLLSAPYLPLIYLYRKRLPLKNRLLLDTVRTWLDFSNLQGNGL